MQAVEDLVFRHHASPVQHKVLEYGILARREIDPLAVLRLIERAVAWPKKQSSFAIERS